MIQELSYRKQIVRQLELYLQWRTNRKSYMVYQTFFNDFQQSLTKFSMSRYTLTLNIS